MNIDNILAEFEKQEQEATENSRGIELESSAKLSEYDMLQQHFAFFGELVASLAQEEYIPIVLKEHTQGQDRVYLASTSEHTAIVVAVTPKLEVRNPRDGEFSNISVYSVGLSQRLRMTCGTVIGPFHSGPVYSTQIDLLDASLRLWTPRNWIYIRYVAQSQDGHEDTVRPRIIDLAAEYLLHATE